MKKVLLVLLCLCLACVGALAEGSALDYRFADADEAAALKLSNRAYLDNLNQADLDFRMQKTGATLAEYEAFAATQFLDFTEAEKAGIDSIMAFIEGVCAERGYTLPPVDDIAFVKSTGAEECDAGGYTHGTQIYLSEELLEYSRSEDPYDLALFREVMTHEFFHCLTRCNPDFRAAMYGILGFTVTGADYDLAESIRERMITNPDVEHHDAYATFEIGGKPVDCTVVFTAGKPFEKPGDSFFDDMVTGLVPVDDLSVMYTSEDTANFWDVFGRNTDYVSDPEETMADNFAFAVVYGLEGVEYANPEIIEKIDALLKGEAA